MREPGSGVSPREGALLFWGCAGLAWTLHAILLLRSPDLIAGGDLPPHLRLMQWNAESLALRNVYAPLYDSLGGLLSGAVGLLVFPKLFAMASAVLYLLGFRFFCHSAKLPETSAALFALFPYALSASGCMPKVEFFGYGMAFAGLGCLLTRRYALAALLLAAVFWVHTAVALVFGFVGGVMVLAARDPRGLLALGLGTLGAAALVALHMADGCSFAEALLFNRSGYWDSPNAGLLPANWQSLAMLSGPLMVGVAVLGAKPLWRRSLPLAALGGACLLLYTNQAWMAPFGVKSVVGFDRGLPLLAVPVAMAAALSLEADRRARWIVVGLSALWLVTTAATVLPSSCFVRPISEAELVGLEVERCSFTWRSPARKPQGRAHGGAPAASR